MSLRWWLCVGMIFITRSNASGASAACTSGGVTAVSVVSRQNATGHWLGDAWVERPASPGRHVGPLVVHLSHERRRCGDATTHVLHLTLEGPSAPVPSDYHLSKGLGYYKAHSQQLTWLEAKKVCEDEGAHLVILNSPEEAAVIQKMVATLGGVASMGFHDQLSEGHFVTVFGEPLEKTGYLKWRKLEPSGGRSENCGNLYSDGEMNDLSCTTPKHAFICEYPV